MTQQVATIWDAVLALDVDERRELLVSLVAHLDVQEPRPFRNASAAELARRIDVASDPKARVVSLSRVMRATRAGLARKPR